MTSADLLGTDSGPCDDSPLTFETMPRPCPNLQFTADYDFSKFMPADYRKLAADLADQVRT